MAVAPDNFHMLCSTSFLNPSSHVSDYRRQREEMHKNEKKKAEDSPCYVIQVLSLLHILQVLIFQAHSNYAGLFKVNNKCWSESALQWNDFVVTVELDPEACWSTSLYLSPFLGLPCFLLPQVKHLMSSLYILFQFSILFLHQETKKKSKTTSTKQTAPPKKHNKKSQPPKVVYWLISWKEQS